MTTVWGTSRKDPDRALVAITASILRISHLVNGLVALRGRGEDEMKRRPENIP